MLANEMQDERIEQAENAEHRLRWANAGGLLFALLQSICTAGMAISGFQLVIGLSGLAAIGSVFSPMKQLHRDTIRIPMMLLALVGAVVNLYSVWRVRSLRARPASQWRVRPVSLEKVRSERVQIALAVVTLILLAVEEGLHLKMHG